MTPFLPSGQIQKLEIPIDNITLEGEFVLPSLARGLVIFAHGTETRRLAPGSAWVAQRLQESGVATVLVDLLAERELGDTLVRYDIGLITRRLTAVVQWLTQQDMLKDMAIGYFGDSTGATAALMSASELGERISCVVSFGGRPDLAQNFLHKVNVPTLLIVGEKDEVALDLNRTACRLLGGAKQLFILPSAMHFFEGPEMLSDVARVTQDWFARFLQPATPPQERSYHA